MCSLELARNKPPVRIVAPGECFRNEDVSARSHVIFHQVEAFCVDKDISFSDLTSMLAGFYHIFFGRKVELRFRHSYFPLSSQGSR